MIRSGCSAAIFLELELVAADLLGRGAAVEIACPHAVVLVERADEVADPDRLHAQREHEVVLVVADRDDPLGLLGDGRGANACFSVTGNALLADVVPV
jgi:hypothetical protein